MERKMQKLGFLVELIVPEDTEIEEARRELANSVGFGRPTVTFRSQIKNWREPVLNKVPPLSNNDSKDA
jgi:hypothetical protein